LQLGGRPLRELADQSAGDARREQRVAGGDDADSFDQPFRRDVLEEEPAGAGAERVVDVLVEVERRQHQDSRPTRPPRPTCPRPACPVRCVAREHARGLDPVHTRHADVHEDDVGMMLAADLHGLVSVRRGADDREVRLGVE
jgi:hypothetical protein